jgi:hypothetical protein
MQESRRVERALTIHKCNEYAVPHPQRFDDSGTGFVVFHPLIIDSQNKENLPSIRHKKR